MLNKRLAICIIFLLVLSSGCIAKEKLYYSASFSLSETAREMRSPGFWTSRHLFADRLLMDQSQIRSFNQHIQNDLKLNRDIAALGKTFPGEEVVNGIKASLASFSSRNYYLASSVPADTAFLMEIERNMGLDNVPSKIEIKYGLTNGYADQRILPVKEGLYEDQGDTNFDELQNSSLDLGTPLAVLHESGDGKWLYVLGPSSDGWVEKKRVSMISLLELKKYLDQENIVVVISAKADIFLDPRLTVYHDLVGMGARFPRGPTKGTGAAEIIIPYQKADGNFSLKKAYVKKESVSSGHLAYTPRNIIDQAFRLLNAPYSWGGAQGEQDCSGFIKQVFSTVGINLPRNSLAQAAVGVPLGKFEKGSADEEKIKILSGNAAGGATLIYMDGHIMLFLGMHEGKPYVIHDIWGYRQNGAKGGEALIIGRVAVTGLDLGKGSSRGSLLERIISIVSVSASPPVESLRP